MTLRSVDTICVRTPLRPILIVIVQTIIVFSFVDFSQRAEQDTHISFCIDCESHRLNMPSIKLLFFSSA